jgi:hypothetical protein
MDMGPHVLKTQFPIKAKVVRECIAEVGQNDWIQPIALQIPASMEISRLRYAYNDAVAVG